MQFRKQLKHITILFYAYYILFLQILQYIFFSKTHYSQFTILFHTYYNLTIDLLKYLTTVTLKFLVEQHFINLRHDFFSSISRIFFLNFKKARLKFGMYANQNNIEP